MERETEGRGAERLEAREARPHPHRRRTLPRTVREDPSVVDLGQRTHQFPRSHSLPSLPTPSSHLRAVHPRPGPVGRGWWAGWVPGGPKMDPRTPTPVSTTATTATFHGQRRPTTRGSTPGAASGSVTSPKDFTPVSHPVLGVSGSEDRRDRERWLETGLGMVRARTVV